MTLTPLILNDLNEGNFTQLQSRLHTLLPPEIVDLFDYLSPDQQLTVFSELDIQIASRVFEFLFF